MKRQINSESTEEPLAKRSPSPRPATTPTPPPGTHTFLPQDHFQLVQVKDKKWKRGDVLEKSYEIKITKDVETNCPVTRQIYLNQLMEAAFKEIVLKAPEGSKAQVYIVNENLNTKGISTQRTEAGELTFAKVAERLSSAIQSDESIKLTETTFYLSTYTEVTKVGGHTPGIRSRYEYGLEVWAKSKASLYDPTPAKSPNKRLHNLCFPLVLANELYALENPTMSRTDIRNYRKSKACQQRAKQLIFDAGLKDQAPFSIEQLKLFHKTLPKDIALNVYDDCAPPFIQEGPAGPRAINVFIKYNDVERGGSTTYHAYGINNLSAFMGTKKFCHYCFKGHYSKSKRGHKCQEASCRLCKYIECKNREEKHPNTLSHGCEVCNMYYPTKDCFDAHMAVCGEVLKCRLCAQVWPKKDLPTHPCGAAECERCRTSHSPFEHCYVQPDKSSHTGPLKVWYGDMETQVDPETKKHRANLVILQRWDNAEEKVYKGPKAVEKFVVDCMKKNSPFKKSTVVFHNAAGFDAHLWYEGLLKAKAAPKSIIRKGQRLISMELAQNEIKCRDSLQFVPGTPLSAFPKMFDLKSGAKGDFPHGLNTSKWIQWGKKIVYKEEVGGVTHRFPMLKYFWPENRRENSLQELTSWHKEMVERFEKDTNLTYCPEVELIHYCQQDVRILREGFETYRKTWTEQYPGLEPLNNITFPSYNNRIFREVYMPKDSLCLLPPTGYKTQIASKNALSWISYMSRKLNLKDVRTARNGYEVKISGHKVDGTGIDPKENRHVFEFHGCFWHGHDCSINKERTVTLDTRRERTIRWDKHLQELSTNPKSPYGSFHYHRIYECEFKEQLKKDKEMKEYVKEYKQKFPNDPLNPRDSLRGGRTTAIKHRIDPIPSGWTIHYVDFTSLYPAVNFGVNGEIWPVGHPIIYIGKELEQAPPNPTDWFGFVTAILCPPSNLLHPVLGQSIDGKLLFHLCTACANNLQQGPCTHSDKEREIKGTFFTGELQLALEKGYKLIQAQELWHWPSEQTSSELFRGLILDQYKKKALSSAVPKDEIEFERLLQEYKETMGLTLRKEDFKENKAVRQLAKFSLNNIWGFLGRRNDMEETEIVKSFARFLEIQNNEDIEVTRVQVTDDEETAIVSFRPAEEKATRNGNIALAAMTTAYARMALYNVIDKYPEHVIYMDTDSLFLLLPPGMAPPATSTVLGGLKDEIHEEFGPGAVVNKFASIGPKSYTYVVEREGRVLKEVVKMKGISFTAKVAKQLTSAVMQGLEPGGEVISVPQPLIRRDLGTTNLFNVDMVKKVQFQSSKRWFLPEPNPLMDTRPYGFRY